MDQVIEMHDDGGAGLHQAMLEREQEQLDALTRVYKAGGNRRDCIDIAAALGLKSEFLAILSRI